MRLLKMSGFFDKYSEALNINPNTIKLAKLMVIMTFAAHLVSCIWYAVKDVDGTSNWVDNYCNEVVLDGELFVDCIRPGEIGTHYLAAIYWAFTTMTTVGYGDILPDSTSNWELATTICVEVLGTMLFAYVIGFFEIHKTFSDFCYDFLFFLGGVVEIVMNLDPGERNKKIQTQFLNDFLRDINAPLGLF